MQKKRFSPNIGYQTRSASTQERLFPRNRYCEHVASFLCTQAVLFATFAVAECKCRVARTRAENARTQSIFLRVSNAHSLRLCANVFCFHLCIIAVLTRLVELTTSLPAPPCGRSAPPTLPVTEQTARSFFKWIYLSHAARQGRQWSTALSKYLVK